MKSELSRQIVEKHFGGNMVISSRNRKSKISSSTDSFQKNADSAIKIPTIEELRKKYLDPDTLLNHDSIGNDNKSNQTKEADVVIVTPKEGDSNTDSSLTNQTVIISDDGVIGSQG